MNKVISFLLLSGLLAGAAAAKEPASALESFAELGGWQTDAPAPAAPLRPSPVYDQAGKGFSRYSNPVMEACRGDRSCFMALDGEDRALCQAYKENKSCFMALDGADRGWCQAVKEGKSCFMALDGADRDLCEKGRFPRKHLFWARCANISLPQGQSNPLMQACRGERSCFMALDGEDRALCQAYKEDKSCFMALDGADRGWCQVMKEGKSCFMALDGSERDRCERGYYPGKHLFWEHCSKQ